MKRNVFHLKFLPTVLFIFLFLCFSRLSCASAPESVDLVYDMSTQNLSVTINHQTLFAGIHYIKYVEVKKNAALISNTRYGSQPASSIFIHSYNLPAQKGDVFEVKAICNLWGHKTSTLVVDASAPVKDTLASPNEAAAAPEPVAEHPAAPGEAIVAPMPVAEKPVLEKTTIPLNIKFNTARAIVEKKYHNDIKTVADFMKAHPGTIAVIEGYTDNVDTFNKPEKNIKLSQARAESVRQYLIDHFGIDKSRISAVGYGPANPIDSNDTEKGRQKNRRVQAVMTRVSIK
jgi:outer membrane protein OmpA-like peptidoglycan-associated protein